MSKLKHLPADADVKSIVAAVEQDGAVILDNVISEKFIAALMKVKAEKGADYFRNYPSKSMMMGDDLKPLADAVGLAHKPNVQGNSYDINQGPVSQ